MSRMGTVAAVCVVAALAFASTRLGAQDDAAREARDRAQIDELMWKYVRALDTLSADAYAANYTPDGSFGATKGRDALKKMVGDLAARQADAKARASRRHRRCFTSSPIPTSRSRTRITRSCARIG